MENSNDSDVDSLHRKIEELREIQRSCIEDPDTCGSESDELLKDYALQIENKLEQIFCDASEINFLSDQDLDEFLENLKNELRSAEAENAKVADEIEALSRRYIEGYSELESEIAGASCYLELIELQGLEPAGVSTNLARPTPEDIENASNAEYNFKIQELGNQLEKSNMNLKSLQDLQSTLNWFEAIEKFEDALCGLKVAECEGNHIRLSLRTFIPLESLLPNQTTDNVAEISEQNHELVIELMDGTTEIKHVKIFPNDVYISELADASKSFRQVCSPMAVRKNRSLEWFVRRVQDRIVLCTLRRYLVKSANNARHSFEYVDNEETIVAHMVGGIDAFVKLPQSWPLTRSGLTLMSLKNSSHSSKEISLPLLCKVAELANSLDANSRQTISVFTDRVEEILMQQMRTVTST